jgi:hypothetical protein
MLMFLGIMLAIIAVVVFVLIAFANGMSDAPEQPGVSFAAPILLALLSVLCFVARHFLHCRPIVW